MIISSPLPDDVWKLQKECPSPWHLGQGSNSLSLITTSSPQTNLLRNTWGFQTSMSKHASSMKTHKYLSWPLSGSLQYLCLLLFFLWKKPPDQMSKKDQPQGLEQTEQVGTTPSLPLTAEGWNTGVELSVRICLCWPSALTKGFLVPGWLWAGEVETVVRYLQNSVLWAYFSWEKDNCLMGTTIASQVRDDIGQGAFKEMITSLLHNHQELQNYSNLFLYSLSKVIWRKLFL